MAEPAASLTPRYIATRRLWNQHLIGPGLATPLYVVRKLAAVQSQDYAGGKWGIGQRTGSATDAEVELALTDGSIVRTHVLRPTWHFVAAEDIRWMLALTGARVRARMAPWGGASITNVLAVEGQLAGGWTRSITARATVLQLRLAAKLNSSQLRGLRKEAKRYGEFLGREIEVRFSGVRQGRR